MASVEELNFGLDFRWEDAPSADFLDILDMIYWTIIWLTAKLDLPSCSDKFTTKLSSMEFNLWKCDLTTSCAVSAAAGSQSESCVSALSSWLLVVIMCTEILLMDCWSCSLLQFVSDNGRNYHGLFSLWWRRNETCVHFPLAACSDDFLWRIRQCSTGHLPNWQASGTIEYPAARRVWMSLL